MECCTMMNDGFYGANMLGIASILGQNDADSDFFYALPEEVQEEVNAHADEFHNGEDMRRFVEELSRRS